MSDHNQVKLTRMDYSKDRPPAENPVKIQDLTLRDGHQSLFALMPRFVVPCMTGHLPALLSVFVSMSFALRSRFSGSVAVPTLLNLELF